MTLIKSEYCIVQSSCGNIKEGRKIAHLLIESKLASCVQILNPIESIYSWKDEVIQDEEVLLLIKTKSNHFKSIEKLIKEKHSYETPEIIASPITHLSKDYLNWLDMSLK